MRTYLIARSQINYESPNPAYDDLSVEERRFLYIRDGDQDLLQLTQQTLDSTKLTDESKAILREWVAIHEERLAIMNRCVDAGTPTYDALSAEDKKRLSELNGKSASLEINRAWPIAGIDENM